MFEISDDSSNDSSQKHSKFLYQAIMTLHTLLNTQEDINSIEHVDILAYVKQDAKHDTRPNIFNYLVG